MKQYCIVINQIEWTVLIIISSFSIFEDIASSLSSSSLIARIILLFPIPSQDPLPLLNNKHGLFFVALYLFCCTLVSLGIVNGFPFHQVLRRGIKIPLVYIHLIALPNMIHSAQSQFPLFLSTGLCIEEIVGEGVCAVVVVRPRMYDPLDTAIIIAIIAIIHAVSSTMTPQRAKLSHKSTLLQRVLI